MFYRAAKLCMLVIALTTVGSLTASAQDKQRKEKTYKRKYYKDRKPDEAAPVAKDEKYRENDNNKKVVENEKVEESYKEARRKARRRYRDGAK